MEEQKNEIPLLTASEIECRVGTSNEKGCSLLLYKDARVDMAILDAVYGPKNWKRSHQEINGNLFCTIEIWDEEKREWIAKQDVGTESNTEKEKGQASDAFKRAGFNWSIGRELYTAPFIWVTLENGDLTKTNKIKTKFFVKEIEYTDDRKISHVVIVDNSGRIRFSNKPNSTSSAPASSTDNFMNNTIKRIILCTTTTELNQLYEELYQKDPALVANGSTLYRELASRSKLIKSGMV